MTFKKILCPIDFSAGSQQAVRVAIHLANEAGAELVLAHVWHVPPMPFGGEYALAEELLQELRDDAQHALEAATLEATARGARQPASRLLAGSPRHQIVRVLEHDPAFDLVVVGTHGRTGLARILLGSVAEGIVRHAPCSVLAVRPDGEVKPFERVLCPIDFSECSQHAAELAAALVRPGSAGVTLLHIIEPPAVYAREKRMVEVVRELDRSSARHLEEWAARLEGKAPVAKQSRMGRPGAEILKALDEGPPFDLVVTGSHGRTGVERLLLGSVAEKVVRHARCPVLIARRRVPAGAR